MSHEVVVYKNVFRDCVKHVATFGGREPYHSSRQCKESHTVATATAYCSAHSPTFPSLHLSHNSFSNPSVALPTLQLILQPFRCFTYVTVHSPTLLSLLLCHKSSLNSPGEPPMISFSVQSPSQWSFHFGEEIIIAWTQEKSTTLGGIETHHSS